MGPNLVRLCVRDDLGGSYDSTGGGRGLPEITVGISDKEYWQSFASLLHEALELSFMLSGLRYNASPDYSADNGNYHFFMDHRQFSEAQARAAMFVSACEPDLRKAYKKRNKGT